MARVLLPNTGRYSPLRYPGGKGKLAQFVAGVIRENKIGDGLYVEPYAGGAAIAWELLLTGIVRRVAVNDISIPVYSFWRSVLDRTDELARLISDTPVSVGERDRLKVIMQNASAEDYLNVGFATFFLNRTHRSGILNGGVIGGRDQSGPWKIDARYNKPDLISRIYSIASMRSQIELTNYDAVQFLQAMSPSWPAKTLVYLDPPYYEKGGQLYYDFYRHDDHANVATAVRHLNTVKWIVSYDDVLPIHELYRGRSKLEYSIGYSARNMVRGLEAMFFSSGLIIPAVTGSMVEFRRELIS